MSDESLCPDSSAAALGVCVRSLPALSEQARLLDMAKRLVVDAESTVAARPVDGIVLAVRAVSILETLLKQNLVCDAFKLEFFELAQRLDRLDVPTSRVIRATLADDAALVKRLLDDGLSPDEPDSHGNTALHYAAFLDKIQEAQVLLDRGAQPFVVNRHGKRPLDIALSAQSPRVAALLSRV